MSRPVDVFDSLRPLQDKHPSFAPLGTDLTPYTTADSIAESRMSAYETFCAVTGVQIGFVGGVWSVTSPWSPGVPLIIPGTYRRDRRGCVVELLDDFLFRTCKILGVPTDVYLAVVRALKERAARCDAEKAAGVTAAKRDKAERNAAWRAYRDGEGPRPDAGDDDYVGVQDEQHGPHAETFDDRRAHPIPQRGAGRVAAAASPFGVAQPPAERDITAALFAAWRTEVAAADAAAAEYETRPRKTKGPLTFAPGYGPDDDVPTVVYWRLSAAPHMPSVFVPLFVSGWFGARLH